jgi:hypothetical protein
MPQSRKKIKAAAWTLRGIDNSSSNARTPFYVEVDSKQAAKDYCQNELGLSLIWKDNAITNSSRGYYNAEDATPAFLIAPKIKKEF